MWMVMMVVICSRDGETKISLLELPKLGRPATLQLGWLLLQLLLLLDQDSVSCAYFAVFG